MSRVLLSGMLAASASMAQEFAPAVTMETARAEFHNAPLRSQGDAAAQTRQAMAHLRETLGGGRIVKLRAFVKDGADAAAVRSALARRADRDEKPALTIVEVGDLARGGARVALEAIASATRAVNPNGLLLVSGQATSAPPDQPASMPELARQSVEKLRLAVTGAGSSPADILRVTAYLSSLDNFAEVRSLVEQLLGPAPAPATYVQIQRRPARPVVEIEAIARRKKGGPGTEFLNPEGLARSPNYTQVVAVGGGRLALTGGLVCTSESEAGETFRRLAAVLEEAGASIKQVLFSQLFPVSDQVAALIRKVRVDFYDRERPPASTMLPFQGVAAPQGVFVVEVVALARE